MWNTNYSSVNKIGLYFPLNWNLWYGAIEETGMDDTFLFRIKIGRNRITSFSAAKQKQGEKKTFPLFLLIIIRIHFHK